MTAKIKLNSASGGGSFSLQAPSSSSNNRVFTIPDEADATLLTSNTSTGKILQLKSVIKTDTASVTDNATPQDISGLSISITPASSSSKFYITGKVQCSVQQNAAHAIFINVNGSLVGQPSASQNRTVAHGGLGYISTGQQYALYCVAIDHLIDATNANAHTIKLQFSQSDIGSNRVFYVNGSQTDPNSVASGHRYTSTLTVMEVAA